MCPNVPTPDPSPGPASPGGGPAPPPVPAPGPWTAADPLGEALHFLRMSGVFYTRSELTAPWGIDLPATPDCLMFHAVTAGRGWLDDGTGELQRLEPGVLTLVPHGEGHRLLSEPGGRAVNIFDLPRVQVSEHYELLRCGGGGAATQMICGAVRFEHPAARRLVAMLPRLIVVESWSSPHAAWMRSTLQLMGDEAAAMQPGGETLVTRLADILVIQAIRTWIAEAPVARTGWLGALQDPQIGRALQAIHREPARGWTVAELAASAAMSRSAFAARFLRCVGEAPMQYVVRWRMNLAVTWLAEDGATVLDVARRLGYGSEAAFHRAFKRITGEGPGAVRRRGRLTSSSEPTS